MVENFAKFLLVKVATKNETIQSATCFKKISCLMEKMLFLLWRICLEVIKMLSLCLIWISMVQLPLIYMCMVDTNSKTTLCWRGNKETRVAYGLILEGIAKTDKFYPL